MLDRDTNHADQLVEALKYHQRNEESTKEAKKKLAIMEQLATQIEQMQDDKSEK